MGRFGVVWQGMGRVGGGRWLGFAPVSAVLGGCVARDAAAGRWVLVWRIELAAPMILIPFLTVGL